MFFYTCGCLDAPYIHVSPTHSYAPRGVHPHVSHILLCASVWSQRLLHVVGVIRGPLTCWSLPLHLPCMVMPLLPFTPPTHSLASLCIMCLMFQGYLYVIWGFFPYVWGLGGVPPSVGGSGGISTWDVHMLIPVHFVVCYVSHFS